jgi:hypothetical protein
MYFGIHASRDEKIVLLAEQDTLGMFAVGV